MHIYICVGIHLRTSTFEHLTLFPIPQKKIPTPINHKPWASKRCNLALGHPELDDWKDVL